MSVSLIDTHGYIKRLVAAGLPEKQAEAIADGLKDLDTAAVATKADIAELRIEIRDVKNDMLKWMIPLLLGQTAVFAMIVKWLA